MQYQILMFVLMTVSNTVIRQKNVLQNQQAWFQYTYWNSFQNDRYSVITENQWQRAMEEQKIT